MIRSRFFWKNFLSYVLIIAFTTFVVCYLLVIKAEQFVERNALEGLQEKLVLFEAYFEDGSSWREPEVIKKLVQMARDTNTRITVLDDQGEVLLESDVEEIQSGENHRSRPEVAQALDSPIGIAKRYSSFKDTQTLYTAKKTTTAKGPLILRLGVPVGDIHTRLSDIFSALSIGAGFGMILSLLMALIIVRRVTDPLSEMTKVAGAISLGNYAARIRRLPRDEIGTLGEAINRLAEAVQANISRREKMEKIRREFSSNVSHELKTPLTSIKGYVDTLLEGGLADQQNNMRFLRIIENNVDRLSNLVTDLLRLATIEANEGVVALEAVDWRPLIQEALARHQIKVNAKKLEVAVRFETEQTRVKGSAKAMSHILDNLLNNALHYTPPQGQIDIVIRQDNSAVELLVKDNGIGIASTDQPRIFERFYRVDTARSRNEGGTGLGLAIVKHLVIQLHGAISVESELGKGATFKVRLLPV